MAMVESQSECRSRSVILTVNRLVKVRGGSDVLVLKVAVRRENGSEKKRQLWARIRRERLRAGWWRIVKSNRESKGRRTGEG